MNLEKMRVTARIRLLVALALIGLIVSVPPAFSDCTAA